MATNQVISVGDASVQVHLAAHYYLIESINETYRIHGQAPVHVEVDDIKRNRSKGYTFLAIIQLITCIEFFME